MNASGPVRDAAAFDELVRAWESAYRDYMAAWEHGTRVVSPGASLNASKNSRTFALRVRGDSMIGAHILDSGMKVN